MDFKQSHQHTEKKNQMRDSKNTYLHEMNIEWKNMKKKKDSMKLKFKPNNMAIYR